MSARYVPVQWVANKWFYDAVVLGCVVAYVWIFLALGAFAADGTRPVDGAILRMRAFGSCAFLMLTVILCIGPLARLDRRFLPLLYNRRHFGVITSVVALSHVIAVQDWYFAFSPTPSLDALVAAATDLRPLPGVPFEVLGLFAVVVLAVLAATSHDFWLNFLSPPVWKSLHLLIYPAYAAAVGHVALGVLQDTANPAFAMIVGAGAFAVAALHVAAWARAPGDVAHGRAPEDVERARGSGDVERTGVPGDVARTGVPGDVAPARPSGEVTTRGGWIAVGRWDAIPDGRAVIVRIGGAERAAVFRNAGALSAVSNACAHQNGPLGEGRIVDGCITCPWHGFQYRPEDGCSPAPFTEKIPTYRLRLDGDTVLIHRHANPPGTPVAPLALPERAG